MNDLEDLLRQKLERGEILVEDADAIREFSEFLEEAGPTPKHPGHDPERYRAAIQNHREFVLGEDA